MELRGSVFDSMSVFVKLGDSVFYSVSVFEKQSDSVSTHKGVN